MVVAKIEIEKTFKNFKKLQNCKKSFFGKSDFLSKKIKNEIFKKVYRVQLRIFSV